MAKNNRGLPPTFNLDIPEPTPDAPVQLGDYLDEVDTAPVVRPAAKPPQPSNIVVMPKPAERVSDERLPSEGRAVEPKARTEGQGKAAEHQARLIPSEPRHAPRQKRKVPKPPLRKQINATPETQRMIEDLIDHVQTYSVQKDAKASEIFHALVLALYEAKDHLDLGDIPARGKWGTPTAQAFPISLKGAFQDAIAQYKRSRR